jgi:hypothetical protein
MKKLILFSLSLLFFACHQDQNSYDLSEDTIEIDDSNIETSEPYEIETRAAKVRITSVEGLKNTNAICDRFTDYYKLNSETTTPLKIVGYGFGASQATTVVKCLFRDAKLPHTVNIISWSDTEINLTIAAVPDSTKNVPIWFRVEKLDGKVAVSSLLKCVGVLKNIHFGQAQWETALQRKRFNLTAMGEAQTITTSYNPTKGDILKRNSGNTEGVIMEKKTDSKGKISIVVWERNLVCRNGIQKKTYKFENGAILKRINEEQFTKFIR